MCSEYFNTLPKDSALCICPSLQWPCFPFNLFTCPFIIHRLLALTPIDSMLSTAKWLHHLFSGCSLVCACCRLCLLLVNTLSIHWPCYQYCISLTAASIVWAIWNNWISVSSHWATSFHLCSHVILPLFCLLFQLEPTFLSTSTSSHLQESVNWTSSLP